MIVREDHPSYGLLREHKEISNRLIRAIKLLTLENKYRLIITGEKR